jgi:hypothetical protein
MFPSRVPQVLVVIPKSWRTRRGRGVAVFPTRRERYESGQLAAGSAVWIGARSAYEIERRAAVLVV